MTHSELILGIDGGGTKTVAWLASSDDPSEKGIVGRGQAGASNLHSVGMTTAIANLDCAIENAFAASGLSRDAVASACIGLAGVDRDEDRAPIEAWAESRNLAACTTITNDAQLLLYAVTRQGWGIGLVAGTGSIAFGRTSDGATGRSGGWGPLLGDEGSGYAIALNGLRSAARCADGRGPETTLLDRFLEEFQLNEAIDLIPVIYAPGVDRSQIAQHAWIVFDAEDEGDQVASEIVAEAQTDLAQQVITVARQLDFGQQPFPLALTGGVLLEQRDFRRAMCDELSAHGFNPKPVSAVQDPVVGALVLATVS